MTPPRPMGAMVGGESRLDDERLRTRPGPLLRELLLGLFTIDRGAPLLFSEIRMAVERSESRPGVPMASGLVAVRRGMASRAISMADVPEVEGAMMEKKCIEFLYDSEHVIQHWPSAKRSY